MVHTYRLDQIALDVTTLQVYVTPATRARPSLKTEWQQVGNPAMKT